MPSYPYKYFISFFYSYLGIDDTRLTGFSNSDISLEHPMRDGRDTKEVERIIGATPPYNALPLFHATLLFWREWVPEDNL